MLPTRHTFRSSEYPSQRNLTKFAAMTTALALTKTLPLPQGEGRGEGEGTAQMPVSVAFRSAREKNWAFAGAA